METLEVEERVDRLRNKLSTLAPFPSSLDPNQIEGWLRLVVTAELETEVITESYRYSLVVESFYQNALKIAPPSLESHCTSNVINVNGSVLLPSRRASTSPELEAMVRLVQLLVEARHAISIQEWGWWEVADAAIVEGFGVNMEGARSDGWYKPLLNKDGTGLATTMLPGELWRRGDLEKMRRVRSIRVDISLENGGAGKWMNGKRPRGEEQQGMQRVAELVVERACPYIVTHGTPARTMIEAALDQSVFTIERHSSAIGGSVYTSPSNSRKATALLPLHHPQNLRASNKAGGTEAARLQGEAWMRAADDIWGGVEPVKAPMVTCVPSHLLAFMEKESHGFVGASHASNRDHLIRVHAGENQGRGTVSWEETTGYVQTKLGADHGVYNMEDFKEKVLGAGFQYKTSKAREKSIVTPTGVILSAWGSDGGKETMRKFAEPMLNDLEWGGRDEKTVTALAKKYRMTATKEVVEAARKKLKNFDEVEAAVRDSNSAGGESSVAQHAQTMVKQVAAPPTTAKQSVFKQSKLVSKKKLEAIKTQEELENVVRTQMQANGAKMFKGDAAENGGVRVEGIEVKHIHNQPFVPLLRDNRTSFLKVGGPTNLTRSPGNIQLNRSFTDGRAHFSGTLIEARRNTAASDFNYDFLRIDGIEYYWDYTYERNRKGGGKLRGTYKQRI